MPTPEKAGYEFVGWFEKSDLSGTAVVSPYTPQEGSVTLYAKWNRLALSTITFDVNGGNSIDPIAVFEENPAATLPTPEKAGYEFLGWFENSECTGNAVTSPYTPQGKQVTLYAKWIRIVATVTFDVDGGNSIQPIKICEGQSTSVTLPTPEKAGYDFGGWFENPRLTGTALTGEYTVNGNVTLYAKWDAKLLYTVTFVTNAGGQFTVDVYTGDNGASPTIVPTKEGHDLLGWYASETFEGDAVTFPYAPGENKTIYAKWGFVKAVVSFETNGGNAIEATKIYGEDGVLTLPTPTKAGFDFVGWYNNAELTGEPCGTVLNTTGTVTLYAKWNEIKYVLTFEGNGAAETLTPVNFHEGDGAVALPVVTKEGHDFFGWFDNAEFSGEALASPYNPATNKTIFAKWRQIKSIVSFDTHGAEEIAAQKIYVGDNGVTLATLTREGYDFDGWFDNAEYTGEALSVATPYNPDENKTIHAKWTPKLIYTVKFVTNQEGVTVNDFEVRTGQTGAVLPTPSKDGMAFLGWFDNAELTGTALTSPYAPSVDKLDAQKTTTVYAKWSPIVNYTVKHHLQNATGNDYTEDTASAQTLSGPQGELTEAVAKTIEHYTAQTVTQATIAADGSTVVNIYYNRVLHAITVKVNGHVNQTIKARYGATFNIDDVTPIGYTVTSWYVGEPTNALTAPFEITTDVTVVAAAFEYKTVKTAQDLIDFGNARVTKLILDPDDGEIVLANTVYILVETEMSATKDVVIKRDAAFVGDLFVLGRNAEGKSTVVTDNLRVNLVIKPTESETAGDLNTITFEGNKANIAAETQVSGSAFFASNADMVLYDGVTIQNFKKTASSALASDYIESLSVPENIGGAAIVLSSAKLTMNGGTICGNEVNTTASASGFGGAIFNYGTVEIHGGTFDGNTGYRGGAIYNYRDMFAYGGTFSNNTAVDGGAIYQANSQYSNYNFKGTTFSSNSASGNGGAIWQNVKAGFCIDVLTEAATEPSGEPTVTKCVFENNSATGNGGAIYSNGSVQILDGVFTGNSATNGGVLYQFFGATDVDTPRNVEIRAGTFHDNHATANGGVLYAINGTPVFITGGSFTENGAANGGAIYVSDDCKVDISDAIFDGNVATADGGAIYLTTDGASKKGAKVNLSGVNIFQNNGRYTVDIASTPTIVYTGHGGAIYASGTSTVLTVEGSVVENEAGKLIDVTGKESAVLVTELPLFYENCAVSGGAIYATDGAKVDIYAGSFIQNHASDNGGAMYFYTSTEDEKLTAFTKQVALPDGSEMTETYYLIAGADIAGAKATINGKVTVSNNTAATRGGALYVSGRLTELKINGSDENVLSVTENNAGGNGGAMYATNGAKVDIDSGVFSSNSVEGNGGSLYIYTHTKNKLNAEGQELDSSGNVTQPDPSTGKYTEGCEPVEIAYGGAQVTFAGTIAVENNTASGNGGGLYVSGTMTRLSTKTDAQLNLTVDGNNATGKGGGMYIPSAAQVKLAGTMSFSNNTSGGTGGGVQAISAGTRLEMSGDIKIEGNTAGANGGGVYVTSGGCEAVISGTVSIKNNTAKGSAGGGGTYVTSGGKATFVGATFSENKCTANSTYGGAVYLVSADSVCILQDTVFTNDNTAKNKSGAAAANGNVLYTKSANTLIVRGELPWAQFSTVNASGTKDAYITLNASLTFTHETEETTPPA